MNLRSQGRIIRFDPKTEKVTGVWERGEMVLFEHVDSRNGLGLATEGRVDLATGKMVARYKYKSSTDGYGSAVDSKGIGYRGGRRDHDIKVLNPETGNVARYPTPTPNSAPRRISLDEEDNKLWFGEWSAGKIGTFDIKTGKMWNTLLQHLLQPSTRLAWIRRTTWGGHLTGTMTGWYG